MTRPQTCSPRPDPITTSPPPPADADRFRSHWAHHHRDLVRYLTLLLAGDSHAAEDIAQETAIRLWQHPEVLADGDPLGGWLRTVARHLVVDRARRRRSRPPETVLEPDPAAGAMIDGDDRADRVETADTLTTLLAPLSDRHRDVVFHVYVRDRAVADVATDLGIPVGTVKSRCHHALRQLRAVVDGPGRQSWDAPPSTGSSAPVV